ncbi:hypothetical protein [Demequina lignilytica]|uniref:Tat (Twin-arginine translocation) pathway signal sequence n=1 Tax=Demequina lignilytica TaxID=3051663 RepID=A0AB35MK72_9MICO|nr:hypothetical protein [Demequina sp. SYSU T0a273]MDN4484191.1 hypothetical protein [Demequina sp. SYSU T0a273]
MTDQSNGVSRRRLIQGAAWATPAIVIASAAPALAQSPAANATISASLVSRPSNKSKTYTLSFVNNAWLASGFYVVATVTGNVVSSVSISTTGTSWFTTQPHTFTHGAELVGGADPATIQVTVHLQSADPHNSHAITFWLYDDEGNLVDTAVGSA